MDRGIWQGGGDMWQDLGTCGRVWWHGVVACGRVWGNVVGGRGM